MNEEVKRNSMSVLLGEEGAIKKRHFQRYAFLLKLHRDIFSIRGEGDYF